MIRAFIAIELPEPFKQEIADLQADFKKTGADVKWVEPANLHLTLKFLGNIEESQVPPLIQALKPIPSHLPPFSCLFEGIGAFPKTTSPRVVWVGTSRGQESLERVALAVEEVCAGLGFAREEWPFRAHLTIGRVRSRQNLAALIKKLQVAEFLSRVAVTVNQITLFQSRLSPQGPAYTCLAEIPLGA